MSTTHPVHPAHIFYLLSHLSQILVFYFLGCFSIGLICPYNAPTLTEGQKTNRSPFVIAIRMAGIKGLPSIINACLITSAVSAASSDLYTSSRSVYALAISGQLPRIFARTTKYNGLPYVAVFFSLCFSFLSYMSVSSGANTVFGWLANMTSVCGLSSWFCIALMYTRFHRGMALQGIERKKVLPFISRFQPYLGYYVLFWTSIVILFAGWSTFLEANKPFDVATFITTYIPVPIFIILFFGSWVYYGKDAIVRCEDIDFYSGLQEIIDAEFEEPPPTNLWQKFWAVIA